MPAVSVVIPTYNRANPLPCAIESALDQTIDDIEVIVVDDGSDDETPAVVDGYDDRVRFFSHEENRGGSAARNTGIEHATGEYIAFLDSDDEWRSEKLARQLREFEDGSQTVAVYCDIVEDRTGLQKLLYQSVTRLVPDFEKSSATEGGRELADAIHANQFHLGGASTLVVRRDVVEAVDGFDETFPRHQDLEFLVRVLDHGRLAYVDEPLVVRHHTGVPDLSVIEAAKQRYFEKFQVDIQRLEADGVPVAAYHRFSLARLHFQRSHFRRGARYLRRARASSRSDYFRLLWSLGIGIRDRL